mgnify:CR=1 FL=1
MPVFIVLTNELKIHISSNNLYSYKLNSIALKGVRIEKVGKEHQRRCE